MELSTRQTAAIQHAIWTPLNSMTWPATWPTIANTVAKEHAVVIVFLRRCRRCPHQVVPREPDVPGRGYDQPACQGSEYLDKAGAQGVRRERVRSNKCYKQTYRNKKEPESANGNNFISRHQSVSLDLYILFLTAFSKNSMTFLF